MFCKTNMSVLTVQFKTKTLQRFGAKRNYPSSDLPKQTQVGSANRVGTISGKFLDDNLANYSMSELMVIQCVRIPTTDHIWDAPLNNI